MKLTTALFTLALIVPAAAQPNRTAKFLHLTTYQVKPAHIADFNDFLKNKWMPAMKKGGGAPRIYSATPAGGSSGVYIIASYVDSMGLFDNPVTTLEKGAGAKPYAQMQVQRAQMIESRSEMILTRQAEMSVYRESEKESPLLLVQYSKNAYGKQAEFRDLWTKELVPAVKKSRRFVSVWRVALGDELQFVTTTPLDSFAELDKGLSIAQLAIEREAYTAWNNRIQPLITSTHREVLRLRNDLMGTE